MMLCFDGIRRDQPLLLWCQAAPEPQRSARTVRHQAQPSGPDSVPRKIACLSNRLICVMYLYCFRDNNGPTVRNCPSLEWPISLPQPGFHASALRARLSLRIIRKVLSQAEDDSAYSTSTVPTVRYEYLYTMEYSGWQAGLFPLFWVA